MRIPAALLPVAGAAALAVGWRMQQQADDISGDVLGREPMGVVEHDRDPLGVRQFATHHLPLEQAPYGYEIFRDKDDGCIKVVLQP